jgi:5-methylcytosine-specific restriction endonuclease McrA
MMREPRTSIQRLRAKDMKRTPLRRQSKKGAARGRRLAKLKMELLKEFHGHCEVCGCSRLPIDLHHIVKRSQGGKDTAENTCLLCRWCHRATDLPYFSGRLIITPRDSYGFIHWGYDA